MFGHILLESFEKMRMLLTLTSNEPNRGKYAILLLLASKYFPSPVLDFPNNFLYEGGGLFFIMEA